MANDRRMRLAALAARAGKTLPSSQAALDNADDDETAVATITGAGAVAGEGEVIAESGNGTERDRDGQKAVAVKFRNYAPKDESLEKQMVSNVDDSEGDEFTEDVAVSQKRRKTDEMLPKYERSAVGTLKDALDGLVSALREARNDALGTSTVATANSTDSGRGDHRDVSALAPRKVNWDLKRDIQPKLDKLEKRTNRAIVELLRRRLEEEAAFETADVDYEAGDLD